MSGTEPFTQEQIEEFIQMDLDYFHQVLLYYLSRTPEREYMTEIVKHLGGLTTYQTASKKLKELKKRLLVTLTKKGNQTYPSITDKGLDYVKWWQTTRGSAETIKEVEEVLKNKM